MLSIDSSLGRTLLELQELINRKNYILSRQDLPSEVKEKQILGIYYKGISVADLALHFTLPGYDSIELKPNGKNVLVTLDNLEEYIQLVCEVTVLQTLQADAFRKGFETLISIENFQWLVDREIEEVLCGEDDAAWDLTVLQNTAVPAHGYTRSSAAYQNLLKVMTSFNSEDRKLFIKFVTGSNRLPLGGFKALSPPLTVVRKLVSGDPDKYLPSVMTCQNYLKLPEYSSSEILAKNLRHAIKEGNEAFHLS
jgi:E3 ubiquitin-protein ligase TRIP12